MSRIGKSRSFAKAGARLEEKITTAIVPTREYFRSGFVNRPSGRWYRANEPTNLGICDVGGLFTPRAMRQRSGETGLLGLMWHWSRRRRVLATGVGGQFKT